MAATCAHSAPRAGGPVISTDLPSLEAHLNSLGNPLVLQGGDTALGPLATVVANAPGKTITLDIAKTPIRIDGDTLTVQGTSTASWPIQGMASATVDLSSVTLTVTSAGATTATAEATLPLGPGTAPQVSVRTKDSSGTWTISLPAATTGVTPTELISLGLGGGPLPFTVPPKLDVFGQVATIDPSAFTIRFAPADDSASAYFAFGVKVATGTWHLIPDVIDFTGLDVAAVITTGAWSISVIGHLAIGGVAMSLGVQVGASSIWTAILAPDEASTFPGIVELANWFSGGSTLGPQTETGFADLKLNPNAFDLALSGVRLSLDTQAGKVVSLEIDSVLTVIGLQLGLVLVLPGITLVGALVKPGTKVVDMLTAADLSTAGVPPELAIAAANFSADAGSQTYRANVTVDGIWPSGPVQLEQIAASVGYVAGTWNGAFAATLGIGGTEVELSATYDAGWVFAGRTLPGSSASIGALIDDLSTKFGIGTVPATLKSLTLTDLHVSYATATGAFDFGCTCTLDVEGTEVTMVATIAVTKTDSKAPKDPSVVVGDRGYSARFGGQVSFNHLQFDLVFDLTADDADIFVADYLHTGDPAPSELKALVAALSATLAEAVPAGVSIDLEQVKFCFYAQVKTHTTRWAFGLRLGTTIDLSRLPVVGSHLPADLTLELDDFQALYASGAFTTAQLTAVNDTLPDGVSKLPDPLAGGIGLQGVLKLGGRELDIGTGVKPATKAASIAAGEPGTELEVRARAATPATASTDPITWVDVNKQFGIFTFRRVGIGYSDNVLLFSLDASVALGPLAFSMEALTVGSPLDRFDPTFSLAGLSLSFDRPPIALGGAFLRVQQTKNQKTFEAYYGEVLVSVPQFSLTAIGGWAPDADPAMFFIYLAVKAPIGGPPFLQITGLSGGFGINSRLVLPTVDEIGGYRLLPAVAPEQPSKPAEALGSVLDFLQKTFEVQAGQYWVAAGIAASSFEMVTVQAVVSVGFGVDVQIGVVGSGSITLPTGDPNPVAYIEIDVVASYTPSTGVLSIIGKLSPASYIFGGFVKLTGGFALCAWFADDPATKSSAGDFVVTIGGYHPAFHKPDNYPVVPRLGIAFSLGPIKVLGQAYIALTPGALMAGIAMEATFEAGPVSAWFTAGLDFLISWAPFHYQAHAWVAIGCKVDLGLFSIRVQIGADLQLWGPPFGGQAIVDLSVVSFAIAFGAPAAAPAPVGWATMAANFLPKPQESKAEPVGAVGAVGDKPPATTELVSAAVTQGRMSTTAPGIDWIVDGNHFRIAVRTTVPANHPKLGTAETVSVELPNLVADYVREVVTAITASAITARAITAGAITAGTAPAVPLADLLPPDLRLALDPGTLTYSGTEVWQPQLDIAPMDQSGVSSYLTVTLCKRDTGGDGYSTYITDLTVLPQLTSANAALWGSGAAASDVNGERLVPCSLVGLDLAPVRRQPDAVSAVALLELIFAEGVDTGFVFQPAAPQSPFRVSGEVSADRSTLDITISGGHAANLPNTGYVLSALVDPWIAAQRSAVLDELNLLGFHTPSSSTVHVDQLATTQLSDWPGIALIGQPA